MKHKLVKKICIFLCLLNFCQISFALVRTNISSNTVRQGETFQLIFTYRGNKKNIKPDFYKLAQDFEIISQNESFSSSYSYINGVVKSENTNSFVLELIPLHFGIIKIPSINFAGELSKELVLQVKKGIDTSNLLTIELGKYPQSVYVGEQFTLSYTIFYAQNISGAIFSKPKFSAVTNGLNIENLADESGKTTRNNKEYNFLTKSFLLSTISSGKLYSSGFSFSGFLSLTKKIKTTVQTKAFNIQVKAIPNTSSSDNWLPARDVFLQETYNPPASTINLGDPLIREITLFVVGANKAQLPAIIFPKNNNLNIYQEQEKISTSKFKGQKYITLRQIFTIIPATTGEITIPEIKIKWFDVIKSEEKIATLPSKNITVITSGYNINNIGYPSNNQSISTTNINNINDQIKIRNRQDNPEKAKDYIDLISVEYNLWFYTALGLLSIWFFTLFLWYRQKTKNKPNIARNIKDNVINVNSDSVLKIKNIYGQIETAFSNNDFKKLRNLLLIWANLINQEDSTFAKKSKKIHNLHDISADLGEVFSRILKTLDQNLYKAKSTEVTNLTKKDLQILLEIIKNYKVKVKHDAYFKEL